MSNRTLKNVQIEFRRRQFARAICGELKFFSYILL